jgi:hypothetical protein
LPFAFLAAVFTRLAACVADFSSLAISDPSR